MATPDADDTTDKNPPLSDVSEAEITALVEDVLKSGTSLTIPPLPDAAWAGTGDRHHARVIASQMQELAQQLTGSPDGLAAQEDHDEWWFEVEGKRMGPLSLRKIRYLWEEGELTPDSLCWREGFTTWVSLFRISELAQALAPKRVEPEKLRSINAALNQPQPTPAAPGWQPSAGAALERSAREQLEMSQRAAPLSTPVDPQEERANAFEQLPAVVPSEELSPAPAKRGFNFGGAVVSGLVSGLVLAAAVFAMRFFGGLGPSPPSVPVPPPPAPAPTAATAPLQPPTAPAKSAIVAGRPTPPVVVTTAPRTAAPPKEHNKPPTVDQAFAKEFSSPGHEPQELTTSQVMQVVLAHKSAVSACVDKQHARDADASGRLVMRWTVHLDGHVSDVEPKGEEFADSPLAGCLGKEIEGWRFPEHDVDHTPVEIPFPF